MIARDERNRIVVVGIPSRPSSLFHSGSRDTLLDNLSSNVPGGFQIVVIGGRGAIGSDREGSEPDGDVGVVQIDSRFDRYVLGPLSRLHALIPGSPGPYFGIYRDRTYARQAALLCAEQKAACIAFGSCPQWAPLFKEHNPEARLVMFERTDWLSVAPLRFARYLKLIDAVICPHRILAQRIAARFPALKERLHVVHDGVDTTLFRPNQLRSRHRILYVGRISPERGVHFLVEAFFSLRERYPDADCILVGKGERSPRESLLGTAFAGMGSFMGSRFGYRRRILSMIRERAGLFLADQVSHDEMPNLYATASVLVQPALTDTASGLTLAEAMSSGLPIVASRCGPAPEMVQHGRTGLLVDPGNPHQLVTAIDRIWDNRESAAKMADLARNYALENLNWQETAARCLAVVGLR